MRPPAGQPLQVQIGGGRDRLTVLIGLDLDDRLGLGPTRQGLDHAEEAGDGGLVADEQPPVRALLHHIAAPGPEGEHLVAGQRRQRPAGGRGGVAVHHHVDVDPPGARIIAAHGIVPPAERPLGVRQHQHDVLAGPRRKLVQGVGGQGDPAHVRGHLRGVHHLELPVLQAPPAHHFAHVEAGRRTGRGTLGFHAHVIFLSA